MKQIKITTSKGEFLVVDGNDYRYPHYMFTKFGLRYAVISEITEEQASEIVDEDNDYGVRIFQNYQTTSMQYFDEQITAIESLHSLLKSKGITELNNKYIFKI